MKVRRKVTMISNKAHDVINNILIRDKVMTLVLLEIADKSTDINLQNKFTIMMIPSERLDISNRLVALMFCISHSLFDKALK